MDQSLAFNGEFPPQLPSPASASPAAVEVAESAGGGGVVGRRGGGEHPPVLLPAAAHAVEPDALLEHAHPQALLEAARLARLPPPLVDLAVVGRGARVLDVSWKQIRNSVPCAAYSECFEPEKAVKV